MKDYQIYRLPMGSPDDVSALKALLDNKTIDAKDITAIIAQTEGDGYARGYSSLTFELLLADYLKTSREEVAQKIPMLMIGLTGGLMSPHYNVFVTKEVNAAPSKEKRFAVGITKTRVLKPEEYGTRAMVLLVADAVRDAMVQAGISDPKDVHLVEVKTPNLTAARIADAESRGQTVVSKNFADAGSKAKGAAALGVALALGEIKDADVTDAAVCSNWNLFSNVASTSAGNEQVACKVVLMGNSTESASKLVIGSGVMKDTLDLQGAKDAFQGAGLSVVDGVVPEADRKRLASVFINAGADAMGSIRGRRTTMKSDFLAGYQGIIAKAVINAIVGAMIGDTMILASAGFEHQGPLGANLVAVIAEA